MLPLLGLGQLKDRILSLSGLLLNRLSVTNLEDLKKRILRVIAHCNKPKVTWGHPEEDLQELEAVCAQEGVFLDSKALSPGHSMLMPEALSPFHTDFCQVCSADFCSAVCRALWLMARKADGSVLRCQLETVVEPSLLCFSDSLS